MKRVLELVLTFSILAALMTSLYLPLDSAAYGASGTSSIVVSSSVLNMNAGSDGMVNYTVKLTSGTTWGTSLEYKSAPGISAKFSVASGDPPFGGTMTVSALPSMAAGNYNLALYATGDDPSKDTNVTVNVAATVVVKEVTLHSQKTIQVNAGSTGPYSVSINSPGLYTLTVIVPQGTYALIGNTTTAVYNFTLAAFNENSNFPSPSSNYTVLFLFVFEVNGQVSGNISFVNSSGDIMPVTTEIDSPSNWTSDTFLGGGLINNGSAYNYANGTYAFPNVWSYNTTSKELVNNQFFRPIPWVFLESASTTGTNNPVTHSNTPPLTTYLIVIVVVVIIMAGAAVVIGSTRRRNRK